MKNFILFITILSGLTMYGQSGCTDPQATNYNSAAVYNNGTCTYNATNYNLTHQANLPAPLEEISGMVYFNNKLYGHQDSGGPANLYEFDPLTGNITKTIILQGATNVDWEDITQDDDYIYIGDVGNNAHGNRTDLKIYKFPKSAITTGSTITIPGTQIEQIRFSYEDQTDFTPQPANSTAFDCEAITVNRGKIHLFTKNWIGTECVHYVLPTTAGTFTAERKDSFDTGNYKITAAGTGAWDMIVLLGYQVTGTAQCALFLDYGFDGSYYYFNTGAKRRLDLGTALSLGQLEGLCFVNALHGYVANEKFTYTLPIIGTQTVVQQTYTFDIRNFIKDYYQHNQITYNPNAQPISAGTIRLNKFTNNIEGYDGTHWCPFNN